jgi:undecaprenyl diphosphate synthase
MINFKRAGDTSKAGQVAKNTPAEENDPEIDPQRVPQHVAIIMDGNGRWAKERGLPRIAGHRAGTENIRRIVETCIRYGVKHLTLYAFSTENWSRPEDEVRGLMTILGEVIERETPKLHAEGVRICHWGRLDGLNSGLCKAIKASTEKTRNNNRLILNVCYNYGGRLEIVDAVRKIIANGIPADQITEELITQYLYSTYSPDPDLIIRTAGEQRLSNFLIWQAAYSEYWFTPMYWPDFGKDEFRQALIDYGQRLRKFGKSPEQIVGA